MPIDRNQGENYDANSNSFHDFSDKTKDVMSEKKMLYDSSEIVFGDEIIRF